MNKKVCDYLLGPTTFRVGLVSNQSGGCYSLPTSRDLKAVMNIGADVPRESLVFSTLLHEATEAYWHMTQRAMEPMYRAHDSGQQVRTFIFTHPEFSEGMADVGEFVFYVWPKLLKLYRAHKRELRQKSRKKRKKRKRAGG